MNNAIAFTGTIKQAVEAGLTFNGFPLGQPELSMLTRISNGTFARKVGTEARPLGDDGKPMKGKPSTIWEFAKTATLHLEVGGQVVTATVVQSVAVPPTIILSDKVERVEPIRRGEIEQLLQDQDDECGPLDDLDGVVQGEDGTWRLSGSYRPAL